MWKRSSGLLLSLLFMAASVIAQEKQSLQVKTLNENLQPFPNLHISINGGNFISTGAKGVVFTEILQQAQIESITVKEDPYEIASWNNTKGVVQVIVRKKNFRIVAFLARLTDGTPGVTLPITFRGSKEVSVTTDRRGKFELPLALNEKIIGPGQFTVANYHVREVIAAEGESTLVLEQIQQVVQQAPMPVTEQIKQFDLSKIDSIQSLTVFYAVFKNIQIKDLDKAAQARIDAKFNELTQKQAGTTKSQPQYIGSISDSSFVVDDIRNLINQANLEMQTLGLNREGFDQKIGLITAKLEKGISNLSERERNSLLGDLDLLEKLLIQNESQFFKNQNDYRSIINGLREKYFDIKSLETKLSEAETRRLEEEREFRQRLAIYTSALVAFGILTVLLIRLNGRSRRQAKALREANEEVQSVNENLEKIVFKRTKLLEESMNELDTFLYRSAHDLRAPLRSILGLCGIVDHMKKEEFVEKIVSTTSGLDHLLKQLIAISEVGQPHAAERVSIAKLMNSIQESLKPQIAKNDIQFHAESSGDLSYHGSPELLENIVKPLLENALFYSSRKNHGHQPRVEFSAKATGEDLELSVYDNGVGMSEEVQNKAFNMFYRGNTDSTGAGLGLFLVHRTVRVLSGSISVNSEEGRYTRFTVKLPTSKS